MTSNEVLDYVRQRTDTVLLGFSRGKDSLCSWLVLRERFRVIPFHLAIVPDLQFVEDSLRYYEDWFGTKIVRLVHPLFWSLLRTSSFQTPRRACAIKRMRFPSDTVNDLAAQLRAETAPSAWIAFAISMYDSVGRRTRVNAVGPIKNEQGEFYSCHDWKVAQVREKIATAGVKLPIDYQFHCRSFNGIGFCQTSWIKTHFPEDYARIQYWFPLVDLELKRMEFRGQHVQESLSARDA